MKIKQITNFLLKTYPLNLQEEWDQSGFLNKGNLNQNISKMFVTLDLTNKVIDEAIKQKVKLIVSHHPIFKDEEHPLLSSSKKIINKVKKYKITVLSLHTCFDNSDIGMNWIIADSLKLNNVKWFNKSKFVCGNFDKQLTVKEIANKFKERFGVSLLTTNAKANDKFKQIAICSGAGLSEFANEFDTLAKKSILLVTGDIKHHGWQDLEEYNLKALDVGHNLENIFVDWIPSLLSVKKLNINVFSIATKRKEKII